MFQEERFSIILGIIENEGKITTAQIQRKCGVGYGTAKNDLDLLAEKGLVQRTHGGAIRVMKIGFAPDIQGLSAKERCENIDPEYLAIAVKAVSLIEKDDVVYLTSASIGYLMAKELPDMRCTVVTNSLSIAEELRAKKAVRVIVTGGEMNENGNFYDEITMSVLRRLRMDKAFITGGACTAKFGISTVTSKSIGLTNLVCENTRSVIGLFPAAKIGRDSVVQICPAEKMEVLITSYGASDEECAAIAEKGVQVVRVQPENGNPGEETT